MKKRNLITRILSALMVMALVFSSAPITSYAANDPDWATREDPRYDGSHPPANITSSTDNYPNKGKSDTGQTPENFVTDLIFKIGDKETIIYNPVREDSAPDGDQLGSHRISVPALFITVKYFDNTYDLKEKVEDYLATHVLTTSEVERSLKLISYSTIKSKGGIIPPNATLDTIRNNIILDGDQLKATVEDKGGYILEELFTGSDSMSLSARNTVLGHLWNGENISLEDSYEYQYLADTIANSAARNETSFTNSVITDIDAIASTDTSNVSGIPVILIYTGFFQYNTQTYNNSSWVTLSNQFGETPYKTSYKNISEYQKATVNGSTARANETYGTAAQVGFNYPVTWASSYHQFSTTSNGTNGSVNTNKLLVGEKYYFGRSYLMNSDVSTHIGSDTKFNVMISSNYGSRKSMDPYSPDYKTMIVSGTLSDYSTAIGYHEIRLSGSDETTRTVLNSNATWKVRIGTETSYPDSDVFGSNSVSTDIEYFMLRNNTTLVEESFVNDYTSDYGVYTFTLTQNEMESIVLGQKTIIMHIKPRSGFDTSLEYIYAPLRFDVAVESPRTREFVDADPILSQTGPYISYNEKAYSYCYWTTSSRSEEGTGEVIAIVDKTTAYNIKHAVDLILGIRTVPDGGYSDEKEIEEGEEVDLSNSWNGAVMDEGTQIDEENQAAGYMNITFSSADEYSKENIGTYQGEYKFYVYLTPDEDYDIKPNFKRIFVKDKDNVITYADNAGIEYMSTSFGFELHISADTMRRLLGDEFGLDKYTLYIPFYINGAGADTKTFTTKCTLSIRYDNPATDLTQKCPTTAGADSTEMSMEWTKTPPPEEIEVETPDPDEGDTEGESEGTNNSEADKSVLDLSGIISADEWIEAPTKASIFDISLSQSSSKVNGARGGSETWSMSFIARDAYAEILGNEAGYVGGISENYNNKGGYQYDNGWASDWNVLAGIPSTENVSVTAGGSNYSVAAAGFIHEENNIERNVTIRATVSNGWGSADKCTPCNLNYSGHAWTCGKGQTHSASVLGDNSHYCSFHCSHCGWSCPGIPAPGWTTHYKDDGSIYKTPNSASVSHDCTGSVGFDCSKGQYVVKNGQDGKHEFVSYTISPKEHDNYQGWNGAVKGKCGICGATGEDKCVYGLIDNGYTTGCGNHNHHTNLIHTQSKTAQIHLTEVIDTASWKEITSVKVYELSYSEISGVDSKIFDSSYSGNTSSNSNVMGLLWHGATGLVDGANLGDPFQKGGHLWYTQFAEVDFKGNGGAWTGTGPDKARYFFGDVTIQMSLICDSEWCKLKDTVNTYDAETPTDTITDRGWQETHYKTPEEIDGKTHSNAWKENAKTGDVWYQGMLEAPPVDALLAWCYTNQGRYKANIVSDFLTMGVSQGWGDQHNAFQDVIADMHAVDNDEGLLWFDTGDWESKWKVSTNNLVREVSPEYGITMHNCKADQTAGLKSGAYSNQTGDQPVVSGYIGIQSDNFRDKYAVQGSEGSDWKPYSQTAGGFFIRSEACSSLSSSGEYEPATGGCLWKCGGGADMPGGAPYEQVVWPDETTTIGPNFVDDTGWDEDLRYYWKDSQHVNSRMNYSNSSGYTWMHAQTNGRRLQDETIGMQEEEMQGYYRHHFYPYTANEGDGTMWRYIYLNLTPYGKYYVKVGDAQKGISEAGVADMDEMADRASTDISGKEINNIGEMQCMPVQTHPLLDGISGSYYYAALVHSNIDIKNTAPNGVYSGALTVTNNYFPMLVTDNESVMGVGTNTSGSADPGAIAARFMNNGTPNVKGQTGVINDIVIHDPISVEYAQVIGNNYGLVRIPEIEDNTGDDMRIYHSGEDPTSPDGILWTSKTNEKEKSNYAVVMNPFNVWISDFGDFYDPGASGNVYTRASQNRGYGSFVGSTEVSNKDTGLMNKYSEKFRGYQNSMNTGTWTWERLISFDFPVTFTGKDGKPVAIAANQLVNLDDVPALTANGTVGYTQKRVVDGQKLNDTSGTVDGLFHGADDKLQTYVDTDDIFYYGLNYKFTVLPSAEETAHGHVTVWARSINADTPVSVLEEKARKGETADQTLNKDRDQNFRAPDYVSKTMDIEIVGRIGNLAMTDVGDFRYSSLFKKATDQWLITGVIRKVDDTKPNMILSTNDDIVGENTRVLGFNHATMSATNWLFGNYSGGKGAVYTETASEEQKENATVWDHLPLTAAMNNIPEYQKEQVRMGYQAYMDIETIGNYYGYNYVQNGNVNEIATPDRGPTTANQKDNRGNVMTIVPKYLLYDYENDSWHGISIYYGNNGNRKMFYNDGEIIKEKESMDLYIDLTDALDNEKNRRCVTVAEQLLTRLVNNGERTKAAMRTSALDSEDFIGTSSLIVLDQYDRNFIGTNTLYQAITANSAFPYDQGSSVLNETKIVKAESAAGKLFNGITDFKGTIIWVGRNNHEKAKLSDMSFAQQSQRWYFSIGLPSSAYIGNPNPEHLTDQISIERLHKELMEQHPNSVVVCFLDIKVQGDIWTLQYDASSVNSSPYKFNIIDPGNPPEGWKDEWKYEVTPPTDIINKKWQPVIVFDKESTSTDDWATYGTH